MLDGFIRVAAASPKIKVGDVDYNIEQTVSFVRKAAARDTAVIVFPELGLTGYTCGDLFGQKALLDKAKLGLFDLAEQTGDLNTVIIVGLPYELGGKLYNVAAVIHQGDIIGIVPKQNVPNYSEFYEMRHFTPFYDDGVIMTEDDICFGRAVFKCDDLAFAIEICEDLWVPSSPSEEYVRNGAQIIFNLSCSDEVIGKAQFRRDLVKMQSAKLMAAYVYCDAGFGESTQDLVFAGHNIIAENGKILSESKRFANDNEDEAILYADIDLERIDADRRKANTFYTDIAGADGVDIVEFDAEFSDIVPERYISKTPFVPESREDLEARCEDILNIRRLGSRILAGDQLCRVGAFRIHFLDFFLREGCNRTGPAVIFRRCKDIDMGCVSGISADGKHSGCHNTSHDTSEMFLHVHFLPYIKKLSLPGLQLPAAIHVFPRKRRKLIMNRSC